MDNNRVINMNEVVQIKKILKLEQERDTYKFALEKVTDYLKKYSENTNNGSITFGLSLYTSDIDEDDEVQLNAIMLIDECMFGKFDYDSMRETMLNNGELEQY